MKYTLLILVLCIGVGAKAQNDMQRTPKGALYQVFTHNAGEKIKLDDIVTFQVIEKTDKDSVLGSTYAVGHPAQARIVPSQNVGDLMEIFPLLAEKDSALVKVPTDSIFKGHEDQRPAFFPKGSNLVFVLKIEKVQSLAEAMAERNAAAAARDSAAAKMKADESLLAEKYIKDHKLIVKTTPSGLKYVITRASNKLKPLKGDTLLVNYTGHTLGGIVFDSSIESVAKSAGLNQPGRTYEPIQLVIGTDNIIQGWDEGLLLLREGEKATFIIPSSLAYGDQGQGDVITPYSTLVFDVELVKIKPIKHPLAAKPVVKTPVHKKIVKKN